MKNQFKIFTLVSLLLISISLISANNVDTNSAQYGNTLINNSNMYYNDGNSYRGVSSGTADLFCKSNSIFTDYLPIWLNGCIITCKSTDNDCGNDFITVENKSYAFRNGDIIPIVTPLILRSGDKFYFNGATLNVSGNSLFNPNGNPNLYNVEFNNLYVKSDLPTNTQTTLFNLTGYNDISNINFNDIRVDNWNSTAFKVTTKLMADGEVKNIFFKDIRLNEVLDGIRSEEASSEREGKVINFNVDGYYFNNSAYYSAYYSGIGYGLHLNGVNTGTLQNMWFIKGADGPEVYLQRSKNIEVNNVHTKYQHDYAVSILDGSKNINVNNIFVDSPTHWGLIYIYNTNFIDATENINANNLYCINCSSNTNAEPTIWINAGKVGQYPLSNININNFMINGSNSYGAIGIDSTYGNIDGLYFSNGKVINSNNAGVRFTGHNKTSNVYFDKIEFKNIGINPINDDENSTFFFSYANTSNVNILNSNLLNQKANHTLVLYAHSSVNTNDKIDLTMLNNKLPTNINTLSFLNQGDYYIDNYKFITSLPSCSSTVPSYNRIASNSTKFYACDGTTWNALY